MQIGLSLSLTAQLRLSTIAYVVSGFEPALVFDFKNGYYRKGEESTVFASAITHAASTNATMVDSDGLLKWRPHNNITKSNTFSTWTKNSTVAVDNAATGPNGVANTASTVNFSTGGSNLYNLSIFTVKAGEKVTLAAWVRSDTITSITFAINGRTSSLNNSLETNLAVTSTWTLVSFEATVISHDTGLFFIIGKFNPSSPVSQIGDLEIYGAHVFRSDLGGMVNNPDTNSSYVPTTNTNVYLPRLGHHIYNGSAWINEGILHESKARTNLLTYSNDLTGASWLTTENSNTANAGVSPDGTSNANKVVPTVSSGVHYTYQDLNLPSADHSVSVYVASAGYGFATICAGANFITHYYAVVIDLSDGTQTALYSAGSHLKTVTVEPVGSFYRVSISGDGEKYFVVGASDTGTYTPSSYGFKSFSGDGTSGILVYGAQAEAGSTPSSYIPTAGATVTRAAETLTVPAANLPYDNTNMSIQMDGRMTYVDTGVGLEVQQYRWQLNATNYISTNMQTVGARTGQPVFSQRQSTSGLDQAGGGDNVYNPDVNVPFNIAARHGSTFLNGAHEGTLLIADTTPTILPDLSSTDLDLGYNFMGTIGQFRMWDEDITDAGIAEAST